MIFVNCKFAQVLSVRLACPIFGVISLMFLMVTGGWLMRSGSDITRFEKLTRFLS